MSSVYHTFGSGDDWCVRCGVGRGPVMRVRGVIRPVENVIETL